MGVVPNYESIRHKSVIIVGVGGVGSVSAEMLVRCGVGKLIIFDYDKVELANMNRLFYTPDQCGMSKVAAAKKSLGFINPDVEIVDFNYDIVRRTPRPALAQRAAAHQCPRRMADDGGQFRALHGHDQHGRHWRWTDRPRAELRRQLPGAAASLTRPLCPLCPLPIRALAIRSRPDAATGRAQARMSINAACNELAQTWLESGVSEDAVSGHVQLLKPGELACFECAPPLIVASGIDEKTLKCALTLALSLTPILMRTCAPQEHAHTRRREGVCAASLPTTMGIVAGFLVQNALKFLLQFGEVSEYVGYIALKDHFPRMTLRPNPECVSSWCRKQQGLYQKREAERKAAEALLPPPPPPPPPPPLHTSNDWGIEVDSDDDDEVAAAPQPPAARQQLAEGIEYAHVTSDQLKETVKEEDKLGKDDGTDLASLMAQLSGVQNVD